MSVSKFNSLKIHNEYTAYFTEIYDDFKNWAGNSQLQLLAESYSSAKNNLNFYNNLQEIYPERYNNSEWCNDGIENNEERMNNLEREMNHYKVYDC